MDAQTIKKLKELREYYYDDDYSLKWIEGVEKNIRRLVATSEIMSTPAVIAIIDDARKRIDTINKFLTLDENLTQEDRNKLYRERNVHQFYLDRFEGRDLDKRFDSINSALDAEIERTKS